MSEVGRGMARLAAAVGLALAVLLLAAAEAGAGRYNVAQCGWYVGSEADWWDSTGGAKLYPSVACVPPPGGDPFAGMHHQSLTRPGQGTISGNRFARWRWLAPSGTGIVAVHGVWWHALFDGFQHRLGSGTASGGFSPFALASGTDMYPREFYTAFPWPVPSLESRLLCAKPENRWCSLSPASWAAVRGLTITLDDPHFPAAGIGGEMLAGGWRRGNQGIVVWGADGGAGLRFAESTIDGARVGFNEFGCQKALIGGEWRAITMRPCPTEAVGNHPVASTAFSDGPHEARACVTDFSGNVSCTAVHTIRIDNHPPAHPRSLTVAGGEGWRRGKDFDLSWANPPQGAASPIAGASWQVVGPAGYDTGVRFAGGRDRTVLKDVRLPKPGAYALRLWLRDEAGNEAAGSAVSVPLRLDDVAPGVAFASDREDGVPEQLRAEVSDAHSGPAAGTIHYRAADWQHWRELPTKLQRGAPGRALLVAPAPELAPGSYLFRADAADGAGNTSSSDRRADGTLMAVRVVPPRKPAPPALVKPRPRLQTRVLARLRGGRARGDSLTVGFAKRATLSGRLTRADGAGIGGRTLRVIASPVTGALTPGTVREVVTGAQGGFELRLPAGPSRRIGVVFPGDRGLEGSGRRGLELRVRTGVSLRARPRSLRTGEVVRLRGRVRGRGVPLPRRGKLVAVQYLEAATRRWRPVLMTRTDPRGRFRARYRFRYLAGKAAIRFRARALAEARWPYLPGSSPTVIVRVRPGR